MSPKKDIESMKINDLIVFRNKRDRFDPDKESPNEYLSRMLRKAQVGQIEQVFKPTCRLNQLMKDPICEKNKPCKESCAYEEITAREREGVKNEIP